MQIEVEKKDFLILADIARCLILLTISFAESLWIVIGLAFFQASFTSIFNPIETSLEPDLVPHKEIGRINAIRTGTKQIMMIIGPALAGFFLAITIPKFVLLIDAFTFGISALILISIANSTEIYSKKSSSTTRQQLLSGIQFIFSSRELTLIFIIQFVLVLLLGMQGPLFYGMVTQEFQKGGEVFGLLMSSLGLGALIGGNCFSKMGKQREARFINTGNCAWH